MLNGASSACGRSRGRYLCYLLFTLKTHQAATEPLQDDEEPETPALSLSAALLGLSGITVVVAVCSECAAPARRSDMRAQPASICAPFTQPADQELGAWQLVYHALPAVGCHVPFPLAAREQPCCSMHMMGCGCCSYRPLQLCVRRCSRVPSG